MRLRRIELVFITITLAFAIFMGGFFTGRSWSSVNIATVATNATQAHDSSRLLVQSHGQTEENRVDTATPPSPPNSEASENNESPQTHIIQDTNINPQTGAQPEAGAPRGGDGKININLATQSELTDLPGIGSVLASRIIDHRRQHGDFQRVEDIRNVSGIGEKRYEAIQDKITVG